MMSIEATNNNQNKQNNSPSYEDISENFINADVMLWSIEEDREYRGMRKTKNS